LPPAGEGMVKFTFRWPSWWAWVCAPKGCKNRPPFLLIKKIHCHLISRDRSRLCVICSLILRSSFKMKEN
jgi:hypothetical protein